MNVEYLSCCGVKELTDIQDSNGPKHILEQLYTGSSWEGLDYRTGRFFLFTQADIPEGGKFSDFKYGKNLAAYIQRNKLGTVVNAGSGINPNSNNKVTVWIWKLNEEAFQKWALKQGFKLKDPNYDPYYDNPVIDEPIW